MFQNSTERKQCGENLVLARSFPNRHSNHPFLRLRAKKGNGQKTVRRSRVLSCILISVSWWENRQVAKLISEASHRAAVRRGFNTNLISISNREVKNSMF